MLKFALFAICVSIATLAQAQKAGEPSKTKPVTKVVPVTAESLMKNPDILWVAESEEVVLLDILNAENAENAEWLKSMGIPLRRVLCAPIKNQHDRKNPNPYPEDFTLSVRTLTTTQLNQIKVYSDPACTQLVKDPYTKFMSSIDTIKTFDPETKKERLSVVVNSFDPALIKSYKVRQLFYFDKKDNTFGSLPLAFAPIADITDDMGKFIDRKPLFWIKIEHSQQLLDLNNDNIQWARKIVRQFDFADMKPIKTDKTLGECINLHLETIRKNAKTEDIRGTMGYLEKVDEKTISKIGAGIDSIITFDPVTFKEIVQVIKNTADEKTIKSIRWSQEWYWDEKTKKMTVYNAFFAPIVSRYDDNGKFLNSGPMYFKQAK